jgi:hypothetical protein
MHMKRKKSSVNEDVIKVYSVLLERFGAPLVEDMASNTRCAGEEDTVDEDQADDSSMFGCDEQAEDDELLFDDSEGVDEIDAPDSLTTDVDSDFADDEAVYGLEEDDMALAQDAMALTQKAPPGGERVVKALKRQKGVKNPWAVAWKMHNRGEI